MSFNFTTGNDEAEDAAARTGGNYAKVHYLTFKEPGDQHVVRYLSDAPMWYTIQQHLSAPTKNAPADYPKDRKWPQSMPATCRYEKGFNGAFHDCYICDAKLTSQWGKLCRPTARTWALACLREPVRDGDGKTIGYADMMREVEVRDDKGEVTGTKSERAIVVVNQAWQNYFGGLSSMFGIYGTITDRDFIVKQSGEKVDKAMNHIPLDPISAPAEEGGQPIKFAGPVCHKARTGENQTETWFGAQVVVDTPAHPSWDRYVKAVEEQNLSLEKIFADRASDEYYARFFDPSKAAPTRSDDGKSASKDPEQEATKVSGDVNPEDVSAMRARVMARAGGAKAGAEPVSAGAGASGGETY